MLLSHVLIYEIRIVLIITKKLIRKKNLGQKYTTKKGIKKVCSH